MKRIMLAAAIALAIALALSVNFSSGDPRNAGSATLTRLLISDMWKPSEALPHGVPRSYDWSGRPHVSSLTPMMSFTAFTAWGQVYQCAETPYTPNDAVVLRGLQSWVLQRGSETWRRIQVSSDLQGAAFAEDYARPAVAAEYLGRGSGGTSVRLRPGYNFHFWPNSGRVSLRARNVVAFVVMLSARLRSGPQYGQRRPCLVLSVGGDLWRSLKAPSVGFSNSGDVGIGRFKRVERNWRLFTMSTATPSLLEHVPLPVTAGLASSSSSSTTSRDEASG